MLYANYNVYMTHSLWMLQYNARSLGQPLSGGSTIAKCCGLFSYFPTSPSQEATLLMAQLTKVARRCYTPMMWAIVLSKQNLTTKPDQNGNDASTSHAKPLGALLVAPNEHARRWDLFYLAEKDTIYHSTAQEYSVHCPLQHDYDKDTQDFTAVLPQDTVPIKRKETQYTWIRPCTIATQDVVLRLDNKTTFKDLVDNLDSLDRLLLQEIVMILSEATVWDTLCCHQCFTASDGSAPKDKGSFAWVLSDTGGQLLAKCSGLVFCHAISSHWAEGYGMLSALRFLYNMVQIHQQPLDTPQAPHLVCNNKRLITTVTKILSYPTVFPNTTMDAEWDCLAQILKTIQELDTLSPSLEHVKGHQDATTPYEELHLLAQLNCDADTLANIYLRNNTDVDNTTVKPFPAGACTLQLTKGTITRDMKHACSTARNLPALQEFIARKCKWYHKSVFELVD